MMDRARWAGVRAQRPLDVSENDRGLGVKNGSFGTITSVTLDSMRVTLDGSQQSEIAFNIRDHGSLDYGHAAVRNDAGCDRRSHVCADDARNRSVSRGRRDDGAS